MAMFRRLFGTLTIDDFAEQLVRELRKADRTSEFRLEIARGAEFCGFVTERRPAPPTSPIFTRPTWRFQDFVDGRILATVSVSRVMTNPKPPSDFSEAGPNLRPRLWSRAGLDEVRLRNLYTDADQGGLNLPCQPIGEHLLACLAYDWPESVQSINDDNLREWGVTVYEALEAALENLDNSTAEMAKIGDHLYSFVSGDTYDAARLMLVDRIKSFELDGTRSPLSPIATRF